jgi:predicted ATPase/class 3 adenylate cyclase
MASLPQGTVTFCFTDIEGSTRLVQELGARYRGVLEAHQALLRDAFRPGVEVSTEGDSFFVVFADAAAAVAAAVAGQRALVAHPWPDGRAVRVRMGLHTGQGTLGGDSYVGFDVHRASRIASAAHGGQVLLSETTRTLVLRDLPAGVGLRDLGQHRLKDLGDAERLYQLVIPDLPQEFPPLASLDGQRTNVRLPLTSFIGRERELAELEALTRTHRLVSVIGTGGTGKTRLLLEAGSRLAPASPDGAWLVELAPVADPELIALAVARAVGAREEPGRPLIDTLTDFLRPKRMLILLDNCEHLVARAAELAERLLAACPDLSIVASSREALGVAGESVFQVPSLGLPSPRPIDEPHEGEDGAEWAAAVADSEAVRLFIDRATAVVPNFVLDRADLVAVVEICRRLDGIPLAIELAAARVPILSVQDIAGRLGDRFRLLTGGSRTAVPRQQTLEAAVDWSWDLLTDEERQLLRRLSVFAGGCTVEAAAAVAMDGTDGGDTTFEALELLARLVAKSLVEVDRGTVTRYRLLETIRQYARERLVASGESVDLRQRHLAYFVQFAEDAEPRLVGPDMAATLSRLDPELDNLRAAIEWGFESDHASAFRICVALVVYGRARSHNQGFDLLARAAGLVDRMPDAGGSVLAARVLAAGANSAWMVGQAALGLGWAQRALAIADATGDRRARGEALTAMAMTSLFVGRSDGVDGWVDEALRLAEELGAWAAIGFTQAGMSQWAAERGDLKDASARLAAASEAAARSGSPEAIAFAAYSRGRLAGFSGDLDAAREAFATAIAAYAEINDEGLTLVVRSDLAHALRHNGATDEAAATYRQTIHEWLHTGNRGAIANQLESVALLSLSGDAPTATRLLAAATAIREAANAPMLSFEQIEYDAAVSRLRGTLSGAEFAAAWDAGQRLSIEDAAALALSAL